jgi:DNA-binding SARP family transcriptional activator
MALPRGAERLLAFLGLHHRPLLRLYVAGVLWPDLSEQHARASLRTNLWRVHRTGLDLIRSTRDHLAIGWGLSLDVREMEGRARRVLDPATVPEPTDLDALAFSGELLPDWYDEWIVPERERLRQLRLQALEALGRRLLEGKRYSEAVRAALAIVRAEPLRESARRMLIEAYLGEGNEAQAMEQYVGYRSLLLQELGANPTSAMQDVIGRIHEAKGVG